MKDPSSLKLNLKTGLMTLNLAADQQLNLTANLQLILKRKNLMNQDDQTIQRDQQKDLNCPSKENADQVVKEKYREMMLPSRKKSE